MRNRATMAAMNLAVRKPMSLAEFLEWEERQELRYEFDGVEPSAMTGRSGDPRRYSAQPHDRGRKPSAREAVQISWKRPQNPGRREAAPVTRTASWFVPTGVAPNATTFRDPVVIFEVLSPSTAARTASSRPASTRRRPRSSVTSCSSRSDRRDRSCPGPGRMERPSPERRRHPRHAGNRPRDPARRILRRPRLRGPSGRRQRQRPGRASPTPTSGRKRKPHDQHYRVSR